jgi:hypothetical protein
VISRRELSAAALVGAVLSVVTSWPLALVLGSRVGHDQDPLLQAWQVAWVGHAWLHQPLHLFQANTFWPLADSLAFTDVPIGYSLAGLIAQSSPHAAIVTYNLLFLFAYAFAFFGAYLLARVLRVPVAGAMVAGAAFAYAPWRMGQDGHLHVISSGGIPLTLALLVLGYRRGSGRLVLAGWLVGAWQMTLGFTLGLQLATLLPILAVAVLVLHPPARRRPARHVLVATIAGLAVLTIATTLQARPYLRVVHDHPEARRSLAEAYYYSPAFEGFLAAPEANMVWGSVTKPLRDRVTSPDEDSLFPGLAILALALVGVFTHALPRRLRIALVVGVATCAAFSLGLRQTSHGYIAPYRLLYELPGWQGVRTPGRLNTLTSLGLALLAGAGAGATVAAIGQRVRASRRGLATIAAGVVLTAAVVVEGRGPLPLNEVPAIPAGQRGIEAPALHLPSSYLPDLRYTFWTTDDDFPRVANGTAGFVPVELRRLRRDARSFPDAASVAALRHAGIRTVVVHLDLAAGTPWADAAQRSVAGLALTRARVGDVVVYRLKG